MNGNASILILSLAAVAFGFAGCRKEPVATNATSQLEQSMETLKQAAPPAPAPVVQMPPPDQQTPVPAAEPQPAPVQQMNQALTSYKGGNYEDAVSRLQKLRAQTSLTPQQSMAIQDALGAVMTELYALAAKGDTKAQQAIDSYQRLQGH